MKQQIMEQFHRYVRQEPTAVLATCAGGAVTMRTVSPVWYEGSVLIFTEPTSAKYAQLRENPRCCLEVGGLFAEAEATFLGAVMAAENAPLRQIYSGKFVGAFMEGDAFGGCTADFLLLKPVRLRGWAYEDGALVGDGMPTEPFAWDL